MDEFRCTIHNITFNRHASPKTNTATDCPICMEESYHGLRRKLRLAEEHRDLLLSVIEIKATSVPTGEARP